MKVIAIVQARMNSSRLPGKVMLPLADSCVLDVVYRRVRAAMKVDDVVVATSLSMADVPIERWAAAKRVSCYRGSEGDVLDRVYQAALRFRADAIVDITADCPLVDPRHIDGIVGELGSHGRSYQSVSKGVYAGSPDYVSNCVDRDWPDGLDVQAYTVDALEKVWQSMDSCREHVGWNIHRQADKFEFLVRQPMAPAKYRLPKWGLTLDEQQDHMLLRRVFQEMMLRHGGDVTFPVESALDWLLDNPHVLAVNKDVVRKEPGRG